MSSLFLESKLKQVHQNLSRNWTSYLFVSYPLSLHTILLLNESQCTTVAFLIARFSLGAKYPQGQELNLRNLCNSRRLYSFWRRTDDQ